MTDEICSLETYFPHLDEFEHQALFEGIANPWEVVARIPSFILGVIEREREKLKPRRLEGTQTHRPGKRSGETMITVHALVEITEPTIVEGTDIFLDAGVILEPQTLIRGPAVIGRESEVRQGAYVRGDVLVGRHCTIGHATEMKNAVFMNHTEAGHFCYVGDSILGSYVNLGAGTKLANLELRRRVHKLKGEFPDITLRLGGKNVPIGMSKLGIVLGDHSETGCNAVTAPGVFVGANSWIYSNTTVKKGYYPPRSIIR